MSITVVGSVALDTVETPSGLNVEGLGGAAVYFSLAARHFCPVHLVGVIGEDFPQAHIDLLKAKDIDITGLERLSGKTFRWSGRYHRDVNERDTLDTQLNVFEQFHPRIPESAREAKILFLANIHPALQLEVLQQSDHEFVGMDTMNLWIDLTRDELVPVLRKVDALIINDGEAKQLTGEVNLVSAAQAIRHMGPKVIVIKKGEHGCILFGQENEVFALPALPLEEVVDPTGAGDSFAGGFMGHIAQSGRQDFDTLKVAAVYGSALASFTCEAFGPDRLATVDASELGNRLEMFRALTAF